jgi:ribonuclease Z
MADIRMRPLLHPTLVNGRFGDPALYVETLFEQRAILFDIGNISNLSPRKIQRLDHVFVSHAHIDHFIGFDRLLRLLVGREKTVKLYGPSGFIDQIEHKLHAYRWNLVDRYLSDLVFVVTEIDISLATDVAQFRFKNAFSREVVGNDCAVGGILHREPGFVISTAILEHRTSCLAFAIKETAHVNVWKNRLAELGLPVGPWLRDLKLAVIENKPDHHLIKIRANPRSLDRRELPLSALRTVLTITPGQKIAYVTDAADTPTNRAAIVRLAKNADLLFIEAAFAHCDTALALERAHLTTAVAGSLARQAGVRSIEPFHFSPRYSGQEVRMIDEVMAAFAGRSSERGPT